MSDPIDDELDQPGEGDASGNTPPVQPATPDLEALVRGVIEQELGSKFDARIAGLQSVMDRNMAKLARDLRKSGLSPEEQQEALAQEESQETTKALRLAELIKRRKQAPEAVDFFIEMMEQEDLDGQLAYIQQQMKPVKPEAKQDIAPPVSGGAPANAPVPDVDKNNPASKRSIAFESGDDMNDEMADALLDSVGPGQFKRLVGG